MSTCSLGVNVVKLVSMNNVNSMNGWGTNGWILLLV